MSIGAVTGSNYIAITRDSQGNSVIQASNMRGRDIGFLGNITGSATIVVATTDDGVGSEYDVLGNGAKIDMDDASQATAFWGTGLNVNITDNDHESTIQWNASGSSLSTENTNRAIGLQVTSGATNNIFKMGWGDAQIIDGGSYNITQLGSGTSYYASTQTSYGALVYGGAGNAAYDIAGNYGVFVQGSGYADYAIASLSGDTKSGHKNAILSNAQSNITDYGMYSLISTTNPFSTLTMGGTKSIAMISDGIRWTEIEGSANRSYVFGGGRDTATYKIGGEEYTINRDQLLYERGWSNKNPLTEDAQTSWYLASGAGLNQTGKYVSGLLSNWLTMGDHGYNLMQEL